MKTLIQKTKTITLAEVAGTALGAVAMIGFIMFVVNAVCNGIHSHVAL